ncbi:hypothetical protein ABC733_24285 [Mangrovibacter sp. SLW1]
MSVNETPLHTADEQGISTGSLVFAIARGELYRQPPSGSKNVTG